MSDYQPPQTKQERIAILLDEINKKTQEVERLTKEETCLIKKENNNNCSELIVVITEIVSAEEHYEATQTALMEDNKICQAKAKLYNDEREAIELRINKLYDESSDQDKRKNWNKIKSDEIEALKSYQEFNTVNQWNIIQEQKNTSAREKYESTLRKLFKPYLIEALANIEWKRANSEMIDVMLNQISVLQTMYQQEIKARDVMLNQISVLQTLYQQETKAREEKRITNVWKFRLFYAGLGVGAILLMNYNFNYPFINVSAPTGYLAMY